MSRRPLITVIIPTYNWSTALRCAIQSVRLQTFQDFEVLVVGDGCTDDTEAVVDEFKDRRIRWHNLERNFGSQWAPNNFGLTHARGDWVAYLGHDDIWYPTHLQSIWRTVQATQADLVTAIMLLYGPAGSGIRGLAGVFPGGICQTDDFVPPSGIAHRRSLNDAIGFWKAPEHTDLPIDCAYFRAAITAGMRIVSSNELSVFKFNTAWRRDAYKLKSTTEQEQMLAKIKSGVDFRHEELVAILQARAVDKLIDIKMADLTDDSVGALNRRNRRFKGIQDRFNANELRQLTDTERFYLNDVNPGFEWHLNEKHEQFGSFRWSGPAVCAAVDLPVFFGNDLAIRLHIIHTIERDSVHKLKLFVNSRPTEYGVEKTASGTFIVHAVARSDPHDSPEQGLRLTIEVDKVHRPIDMGSSGDHRWLGVAVNWIEVTPSSNRGLSAVKSPPAVGANQTRPK